MNKIIEGCELPENKWILISLTYVKGIGLSSSKKILKACAIEPTIKTKDVAIDGFNTIAAYIEANYLVENTLTKLHVNNVKRKIQLETYEGLRWKLGLPLRGQSTQSNGKTRKKNKHNFMKFLQILKEEKLTFFKLKNKFFNFENNITFYRG